MNRRQKIIVSIVGIVIVSLFLIGLTYGYFLTKITGNNNEKSISVTTADLKLVYNDGSDGVIGGELLIPSDTVYTKTFTVKNEGNTNIEYGVYLINVINQFVRKDDVKYTLSCTTNGSITCNGVTSETTFPSGINQLVTNTIEKGKIHTYTFKFTYKDTGTDQSIDMGKELSAKIQIFTPNDNGTYYPYEEGTLAYNIINNSINQINGTKLLSAPKTTIGNAPINFDGEPETFFITESPNSPGYLSWKMADTKEGAQNGTTPTSYDEAIGKHIYEDFGHIGYLGKLISYDSTKNKVTFEYTADGELERSLISDEDDYGTTYYYRGDVKDNYVSFANKLWRIVRINGDGSVKIVSETRGDNLESYTKKIDDVIDNHATALKNFQKTLTSTELEKLKSGNWCYQNTVYESEDAVSPLTETKFEEILNTGNNIYGDAYRRLLMKSPIETTFKCNGKVLFNFADGTNMYVASLTADEVIYAGTTITKTDKNYSYLGRYRGAEPHIEEFYSLFSIGENWSPIDNVYFVTTMMAGVDKGYITNEGSSGYDYLRPTIQIKQNIIVTGDGTKENPYVLS